MQTEQWNAVEGAISTLPPGEFHFSAVYGSGWDALYVGDKVKFGRKFMNLVRKGDVAKVSDTGKKKAGGRIYLRSP